jgi:hypothetical protein
MLFAIELALRSTAACIQLNKVLVLDNALSGKESLLDRSMDLQIVLESCHFTKYGDYGGNIHQLFPI